jgi:hypothetical protein
LKKAERARRLHLRERTQLAVEDAEKGKKKAKQEKEKRERKKQNKKRERKRERKNKTRKERGGNLSPFSLV